MFAARGISTLDFFFLLLLLGVVVVVFFVFFSSLFLLGKLKVELEVWWCFCYQTTGERSRRHRLATFEKWLGRRRRRRRRKRKERVGFVSEVSEESLGLVLGCEEDGVLVLGREREEDSDLVSSSGSESCCGFWEGWYGGRHTHCRRYWDWGEEARGVR
jgi:hypothetical protein